LNVSQSGSGATTPAGRVDELDSLRGLAAITVVAAHLIACVPFIFVAVHDRAAASGLGYALLYTPLRLFVAGNEAVILFFVLSGFVLSLPFFSSSPPRYRMFLIRRICRIYLPFAALLVIGLAVYAAVTVVPLPEASPWASESWSEPITTRMVAGYLLMTGFAHHLQLNPPAWSLVHEMRISLVFPLIFAALNALAPWRRLLGALAFSAFCAFAASAVAADGTVKTSAALTDTLLLTGSYVWFFVLGIELARYRTRIAEVVDGFSAPTTALAFAVAATLYISDWLFPPLHGGALSDFIVGFGAAGFIALALGSSAVKRLLTTAPLLLLGRVSYSLYLIHLFVTAAVLYELHDRLSLGACLLVAALCSIGGAWISYHAIEKPMIRLGRRLTAGTARGAVAAAAHVGLPSV